jgi:hypothetical protein
MMSLAFEFPSSRLLLSADDGRSAAGLAEWKPNNRFLGSFALHPFASPLADIASATSLIAFNNPKLFRILSVMRPLTFYVLSFCLSYHYFLKRLVFLTRPFSSPGVSSTVSPALSQIFLIPPICHSSHRAANYSNSTKELILQTRHSGVGSAQVVGAAVTEHLLKKLSTLFNLSDPQLTLPHFDILISNKVNAEKMDPPTPIEHSKPFKKFPERSIFNDNLIVTFNV